MKNRLKWRDQYLPTRNIQYVENVNNITKVELLMHELQIEIQINECENHI